LFFSLFYYIGKTPELSSPDTMASTTVFSEIT
jgi:hypothetical protein